MKTIRETEKYRLIHDEEGNSVVYDIENDCQSRWKVGVDVRDEVNHIKHLNDEQFDKYCKDLIEQY